MKKPFLLNTERGHGIYGIEEAIMKRRAKSYGLTRKELGIVLKESVPNYTFIYDKAVPGSSLIGARPDYRCEELSLILEMNNFHHYCSPYQMFCDSKKYKDWHIILGYRVVNIPYFVQMCNGLISIVTKGRAKEYEQRFKHGFRGDSVILPAHFCEQGVELFKKDLEMFSFAKEEIIQSLRDKVEERGDISLVLPPSLWYLLK